MLTTPVKNACILSAKNAYGRVHARLCNGAEASLSWKLLRTYLESCACIVQAVVCRLLLLSLLLSRPNPSPDAVRTKKSVQIHASCRCGVAQASFDHPRWCRPHPVCLWVALSLGRSLHLEFYFRRFFAPFFPPESRNRGWLAFSE